MATNEISVPEERIDSVVDDVKETAQQQTPSEARVDDLPVAQSDAAEPAAHSEAVDFSDEEAALAADASDLDLGEEEDEGEDGDSSKEIASRSELDLGSKTKAELVELLARSLEEKPVQTLRGEVEAIKVAFYKLHRNESEAARKQFAEAGGDPEAFEAPADVAEARLKDLVGEYRRKRDAFLATIEEDREANLKTKLAIIEELKALVGGSETVGQTFNAFRELQQRWRDAGPVPVANVKDLWETYNHHVENFYSYIKINKELRDLDLRKNYEVKLLLCEEAEALLLEPSIIVAFHKLQKLHDQWRETGPVAAEFKESVWERFREASGRINRQHQTHFDEIKEEQKKNLDLKTELCEQVEALSKEPLTSRKEWNKASDRLLEIQKVWKTIGFAPRKNNTRVYERFRTASDAFFAAKREYYNGLKGEMDHNLELKNEICLAAEALAASDDWRKTSDELIALQKRWKEIGPVPRRHSDAVWKRFRAACDAFFERKNNHFSGVEGGYKENLERKRALLAAAEAKGFEGITFDDIKEFQRQWSEIGYVPIKQKESVAKQYKELVDKMFTTLRGGEQQRSMERFRNRVSDLKTGGDKRLRSERERLFNKVKQLEGDIATLENNIGFFGRSKNAEAMIAGVREKIARTRGEMAEIIEKIKLIDAEEQQ
ncbi:MAG: DUF349 domain-containing protein [Alistipes sp.]|jgi:hypothetical protein|nr:DUF349 domain-containing protein [Alistipes sp.]